MNSARIAVAFVSSCLFAGMMSWASACSGKSSETLRTGVVASAPSQDAQGEAAAGETGQQPDGAAPEGLDPSTAASASGQVPQELVSASNMVKTENATAALNLASPLALVLGPAALQSIYAPVFGSQPRLGSRVAWFSGAAAQERVRTNPEFAFFSPSETVDLGGTVLQGVWEPRNRGLREVDKSVVPRPALDAQYLAALRTFLGDACRNLINREANVAGFDGNLLYSGETLEAGRVAGFLRQLSGLAPGPASNVDGYVAAFPGLLPQPLPEASTDRLNALKVAYQHLCVALASDIRVITR